MLEDDLRRITQMLAEQKRRMHEALESPGVKAFLDRAAEQRRRMHEALESPGVNAFLDRAAEQQRRMHEALESPGVKAFLDRAAEQQRRLGETMAIFAKAGARVVEAYRAWDEAERRILDLLVPRGWLVSPGTSLSEIHQLLRLADEEGVDAVEEALVQTLSPSRCRQIIEGLYDRPSFAVWQPVLEQALVAHEQGMYALAVPVWLIALDGIVLVELGVDNVFARVQKRKGLAVRAPLAQGNRARLVDALVSVIRTVAAHLPRGTPPRPQASSGATSSFTDSIPSTGPRRPPFRGSSFWKSCTSSWRRVSRRTRLTRHRCACTQARGAIAEHSRRRRLLLRNRKLARAG